MSASSRDGLRFDYLCDRAALAPELAAAHAQSFAPLLPEWSTDDALRELRTHTRRCAIPTTLLACEGEAWLGSVSLLRNDSEQIRQYSPWLASLYVKPEARGRGLGRALVGRCLADAVALKVTTLHLYCEAGLVDFYQRQGWSPIDTVPLAAASVRVMSLGLGERA